MQSTDLSESGRHLRGGGHECAAGGGRRREHEVSEGGGHGRRLDTAAGRQERDGERRRHRVYCRHHTWIQCFNYHYFNIVKYSNKVFYYIK